MMLLTMYVIVSFGVFLSAIFEGEGAFWSFVAGVFWPVVLWRIVAIRLFGK